MTMLGALQDLFQRHRDQATGHWKVEDGGTRTLFLDHGDIVFASSTHPEDRITALLVERGKLTQAQLDYAMENLKPGVSVGRNLMDMGFITQRDLLEVARLQVDRVVQGAMGSLHAPAFEDRELDAHTVRLPLDTPQLLLNTVLLMRDREMLLELLGPLNQVVILEGRRHQNLSLPTDLQALPGLMDGTRSVLELSREVAVEPVRIGALVLYFREMGWARLHELPPLDRAGLDLALTEEPLESKAPEVEVSQDVAPEPAPTLFNSIQAAERPTTNLEHLSRALDELEEIQALSPLPSAPGRLFALEPLRTEPTAFPPAPIAPEPVAMPTWATFEPEVREDLPIAPIKVEMGEANVMTWAQVPEPPHTESLEDEVLEPVQEPAQGPALEAEPEVGRRIEWEAPVREEGVSVSLEAPVAEGAVKVLPLDPEPEEGTQGRSRRPLVWGALLVVLALGGGFLWLKGRKAVPPPSVEAPKATPAPTPAPTKTPEVTPAPQPAAEGPVPNPEVKTPPVVHEEAKAADPLGPLKAGDLPRAAAMGEAVLKAKPSAYAVRILIACQADTVQKVPAHFKQAPELFVLPMTMKDRRSCYQVFMGPFKERSAAEAARDALPSAFGSGRSKGLVFRLDEIRLKQ